MFKVKRLLRRAEDKKVSETGSNDIITDKVNACFKIVAVSTPSKVRQALLTRERLSGKSQSSAIKSVKLQLNLQFNVGSCTGSVEVNESVTTATRKSTGYVPVTEIEVECGIVVVPESCPAPVNVTIGGCDDAVEIDAGKIDLESLGRILQIDVTIRNVCPHKRVALAVIVTEVDSKDKEHKRGVKILTIPAHTRANCQDVEVRL